MTVTTQTKTSLSWWNDHTTWIIIKQKMNRKKAIWIFVILCDFSIWHAILIVGQANCFLLLVLKQQYYEVYSILVSMWCYAYQAYHIEPEVNTWGLSLVIIKDWLYKLLQLLQFFIVMLIVAWYLWCLWDPKGILFWVVTGVFAEWTQWIIDNIQGKCIIMLLHNCGCEGNYWNQVYLVCFVLL